MKSNSIQISGKVQDVWYRKHTCDKAVEIGLTGTVENLEIGDVLIHATGTEEQIKQLVEWCWSGSPLSNVTAVRTNDLELSSYPDFRIIE